MSSRLLFPVISRPTVNFLEALAAVSSTLTPPFAGTPINNLIGVPPLNSRRYLIRAIGYTAIEDVGLEFDFYADAAGAQFLCRYQFTSSNGAQYAGAGLYQFYVDGLSLPYYDADTIDGANPPTLHVGAQNVDTVAKSAAELGTVTVTFWLEPMQSVQG